MMQRRRLPHNAFLHATFFSVIKIACNNKKKTKIVVKKSNSVEASFMGVN